MYRKKNIKGKTIAFASRWQASIIVEYELEILALSPHPMYSVVNTLLPTPTASFIKLACSKRQTLKIQPAFSIHSGFLVRLYTVSSQFSIFSMHCHLKKTESLDPRDIIKVGFFKH
jgi:hypothetical protein